VGMFFCCQPSAEVFGCEPLKQICLRFEQAAQSFHEEASCLNGQDLRTFQERSVVEDRRWESAHHGRWQDLGVLQGIQNASKRKTTQPVLETGTADLLTRLKGYPYLKRADKN